MQKLMSLLSKKRDQKGFTLIELLVVIAIVGTLMAVGVSNYLTYKTKGADASAKAGAADCLTLALADIAANTYAANQTYTCAAGNPTGFAPPPNVTFSNLVITPTGTITAAATAVHTSGTTTYTINVDGTITP